VGATKVGVSVAAGFGEIASVAVSVGVLTYCEMTSTVSAAMVFMLENAESTMFCG
jgi:hypothetical protein